MPNGIDKNWSRMCAAIDGYRNRYGSWPTMFRLPKGAIEHLFTEETLARIGEKIKLVEYDGSPFMAEDNQGRSYQYGEESFREGTDIRARDWLGVEPDSEIVIKYYRSDKSKQEDIGKGNSRITSCLIILLSELSLFSLVIMVFTIMAATLYDGDCAVSLRPPPSPCSFGGYMQGVILMIPFGLMILGIKYWWITLLLLIIFPMIGMKISVLINQRAK